MNRDELFREFVIRDPCEPPKRETGKWDVYGKSKYCPVVKVTNWWYHRESYPKDNDDYVRAAYKRWGNAKEDEMHWKTETGLSMETGRGDPEVNARRKDIRPFKLLSFLSYPITMKTRKDLLPDDIRKILPSLPRDQMTMRYTTTNQAHYKWVQIIPK